MGCSQTKQGLRARGRWVFIPKAIGNHGNVLEKHDCTQNPTPGQALLIEGCLSLCPKCGQVGSVRLTLPSPPFGGVKAQGPLLPASPAQGRSHTALQVRHLPRPLAARWPRSTRRPRSAQQHSCRRGLKSALKFGGTRCGSPCDPHGEALPLVSRLSGCVISGINTAVFVSPHGAPDRAAARPAACSWSLAPWHGRHRGPEEAPPTDTGHRNLAERAGGHGGAGVTIPGGEASVEKPAGLSP